MANGKDRQDWTPLLWCRACGGHYKRYVGGLRECCARCTESIHKIEAVLAKELNESMSRILNNVRKKEGE